MNVYDEFEQRGMLQQCTNPDKVRELLSGKGVRFYIGFDCTADSLHVGHFLQFIVMRKLQRAGHVPVALLGGGTTMVGDPTGRTDMRKMLTREEIDRNAASFKRQMEKFIDFSDGRALMVNNADWLCNLNYIDFLREVGVYFSVNKMLSAECYKTRLEKGLSFIEFNYMLMQSYDFLRLFEDKGCRLELGGDDQWANILGGVDLIRRVKGEEAYGMTFSLLTNKEGKKMGKTASGALWIDRNKTTPYEFFQYWRNVDDADLEKCMKMLTDLPLEDIRAYTHTTDGKLLNEGKQKLAYELTALVHSKQDADEALGASQALFAGAADSSTVPSATLTDADFENGVIDVCAVMVHAALAASRSEARRTIEQGGLTVNGEKVTDKEWKMPRALFEGEGVMFKKGKKSFCKVILGEPARDFFINS